jgi:hypothetical protein
MALDGSERGVQGGLRDAPHSQSGPGESELAETDGNRTHLAIFKAESLRHGLKWPVLNRLDRLGRCRSLL